jgi:hypothetical protein
MLESCWEDKSSSRGFGDSHRPTFSGVLVVDREFEVRSVTQSTLADNLSLEFKNGNTSTVKGNPRRLLLGLEFEMNGR